jgi:hypothetical protein
VNTQPLSRFGSFGSDSVVDAIGRAAARTGVDFDYLYNQAKTESGLNPNARARTSSASGLYQFIDQSWLGVLKQHGAKHGLGWAADAIQHRGGRWTVAEGMRDAVFGLRDQPDASALMAAESASDNADMLGRALGRTPSAADLYFAHFLGPDGAARFLRAADANSEASAASLFPREARANRSIFYDRSGGARSLGQVYQLMAKKIGGDGSTPAPAPPAQDDATQLAYAAEVFRDPEETPTAERLARYNRFDPLRPDPKHAMAAYLMLASAPISDA